MRRLSSIIAVMALVAGACSGSGGGETTTSTDPPATTTGSASGRPRTTSSVAPEVTSTPADAPASTTTTVSPDLTPPQLAVAYPTQGARTTENPVQFRGTIESDCTLVAAGRYPVTVTTDGAWAIALFLDSGSNVAVFDAFDAAGNQTTVNRQVYYDPPTAQPAYLRWDETGLYRNSEGSERQVVAAPIWRAADDHMGGVLYEERWGSDRPPEFGPDRPGTWWLPAGAEAPGVVEPVGRFPFAAAFRDRPTVFHYHAFDECEGESLARYDLLSGTLSPAICSLGEGDGGIHVASSGGDRYVGVAWVAAGPGGTDRTLHFFNEAGEETSVTHNPYPTSCEPCELRALLSPDGSLLAYRFRPDAKWPDTEEPTEDWWERSRHIPADIVVLDLDSGYERWRIRVPAGTRLADFDGRSVVTTADDTSTVHDTRRLRSSFTVTGGVALIHDPVASPAAIEPRVLWGRSGHGDYRDDDYVPGSWSSTRGLDGADHGFVMVVDRGYVDDHSVSEFWTSNDGRVWSIHDLPNSLQRRLVSTVARTEFGYLIGTERGHPYLTEVWSSTDGSSWVSTVLDEPDQPKAFSRVEDVIAGPGGAIVHLRSQDAPGTGQYEELFITSDGTGFTSVLQNYGAPGAPQWVWVAAQDHHYVAIAQQGSLTKRIVEQQLLVSRDGSTWTTVTERPFGDLRSEVIGIAANHKGVVVAAVESGRLGLLHSHDLSEWHDVTPAALGGSAWLTDFSAGSTGFLLTVSGQGGSQAWFSVDGLTWDRADNHAVARALDTDPMTAVGAHTLIIAEGTFGRGWYPTAWFGVPISYD